MTRLGKQWQTQNLKEKLMWLAVFTIIVFMSLLYVLNRILNLPTTINNDISGWYSLILSSAIGIYITFAILIYSNASQQKTDDIIQQQKDFQSKKKSTGEFFVSMACQPLLISLKKLMDTILLYDEKKITSEVLNEQLEKWGIRREISIEHLNMHFIAYSDVLNPDTLRLIFETLENLKILDADVISKHPSISLIIPTILELGSIAKSLESDRLVKFIDVNSEIKKLIHEKQNQAEELMKHITPQDLTNMMEEIRKKIE